MKTPPLVIGWMALCLLLNATASRAEGDNEAYERIWRQAVLYENTDEQAWLQRFALSGRAQGDYTWFDADEGDYDDPADGD